MWYESDGTQDCPNRGTLVSFIMQRSINQVEVDFEETRHPNHTTRGSTRQGRSHRSYTRRRLQRLQHDKNRTTLVWLQSTHGGFISRTPNCSWSNDIDLHHHVHQTLLGTTQSRRGNSRGSIDTTKTQAHLYVEMTEDRH